MSWCWGNGTSVICWRITRPTTTGCARTLRSTGILRSIDRRRQSGVLHQSLGSAVYIGPGVDGVTWQDYEADLELRIEDLHGRVHRGAYRPQPSRRVYIDKADGKQ